MFCLQDFEEHAKRTLDTNTWCFHSTGAMNEQTLKDNIEAYSRYIILEAYSRYIIPRGL